MSKICNNCGNEVDDGVNFCPKCKCNTFRYTAELTEPKNDLKHRIFYWNYPQGSILSKSKLSGIAIFIFLALFWLFTPSYPVAIPLALVFGLITFLIGFVFHKIKGEPKINKLKYNDYGLITDLKHLLFYWQTRNGGYVLSKTKIISFAIFLLGVGIGLATASTMVAFTAIIVGVFFEVPALAIGFGIHKLTSDDSNIKPELPQKKPKKEIKETPKVEAASQKPNVIPEYLDYQLQLDDLNSKFQAKEKSTRDLIAKRFEPPQLTYTRFITGVDKSKKLFEKHRDSAYTMISLADEYSPRIASEIEAKIEILKAIIDKMDSLSSELIVSDNITTKEDVDDLIGEMDNLIDSVRDYE